jgi:hypothetical protein
VNANITFQDYRNAMQIYGKDLGDIKGKTTHKKPYQMPIITFDKPSPKNSILSVDIMFFTGLTFLTTVSRNVTFVTATWLETRKRQAILKEIQKIFCLYKGKGHSVDNVGFLEYEEKPIHTLLADNKFQTLKDDIENKGVQVHVVTKNEHVGDRKTKQSNKRKG